MKGILILEGQDCSGKTTLAQYLLDKYKGVYIHATYRFKNKMPIYHAALLRKALKLSKNQLVIIDRLHISEYIYAKVFRGGTPWPEVFKMFNSFCKKFNIPIILCVPDTINRGLIWFEQTKQKRPEMYEDIKEIIIEYCKYANEHQYDNNVIIYNRDFAENYKEEYFSYIIKMIELKMEER